ncbi:MAG: hypothetical protein FVQ79_13475, partial [Planctomycetes bacterium]|nr:hypothetical protein [Planctomycetota bacterium]
MSYTVEQSVGKHVYLYEVTAYWDKEKKQPRQKRTFIGKKDPVTGEIIPKKQKRCLSFEYGPIYFLTEIVETLELHELLLDVFPSIGREVLLAACFRVADQKPFYLCEKWLDRTYLTTSCDLSSQRLSELVQEVGEDEKAVFSFLHRWASQQRNNQFIVFDITSISSYSHHIDYVEWGHNRDKERLAQINLGIVYGEPPDTPLFYSVYPGSIPDVKTLKNILKKLSVFEVAPETLFVMDKGFYSRSNLVEMGIDIKFLIPLPANNKVFRELVTRHVETMVTSDSAFHCGKQLLYKVQDSVRIGEVECSAHLFLDTRRKQQEESALHAFLLEVESRVSESDYTRHGDLKIFLDENFSGWKHYFTIRQQNGMYELA